jgi:hypothetical protein
MTEFLGRNESPASGGRHPVVKSRSIDWYSEGQGRTVEVAGIQVTVRLVGRKGRRARIEVSAPPGALFRDVDPEQTEVAGRGS